MAYKLSVIIPVYNAEKTLERAFLSVKNQTIGFENIELLICDDCSTDKSYKLIQEWAEKYPNVKAFKTNENSGAAGTPRNVCLDNATAPFVMFLDNDDEYFINSCEVLLNAIEQNNEVDIVSGRTMFDESSEVSNRENKLVHLSDSEIENFMDFFMECIWTKIYRRSVIEKYSIRFPQGFCEDVVFLSMFLAVCRFGYLTNSFIIHYTVREDSASHVKNVKYYEKIPNSIIFGLDKATEYEKDDVYLDILSNICFADGYIEELLRTDFITTEVEAILDIWKPVLSLCFYGRLKTESSFVKILIRDIFDCGDIQKTLKDFNDLRRISKDYDERIEDEKRQRRKELDDIYGSTTWKVASLLQRIKFWSK